MSLRLTYYTAFGIGYHRATSGTMVFYMEMGDRKVVFGLSQSAVDFISNGDRNRLRR